MKKILLLTKIHPIEILDVMIRLYHDDKIEKDMLVFSPQYTAMLASESTGGKFQEIFYSGIKVWEEHKEEVIRSHPEFNTVILVGTTDKQSLNWFDAIVGLDNPDINDYVMDEDFNVDKIKYFTTSDAEIHFNELEEVITFIHHIYNIDKKETENAI